MTAEGLASIARTNRRRQPLPRPIPPEEEEAFMQAMIDFATSIGYRCVHQRDSRRTTPGWPDVVFCRPPRLIYVEFKSGRGHITPEQEWWLAALGECGEEVYRVWPSDKGWLAQILMARTRP